MSFMILCPLQNSIQTSKVSFETTQELYASASNIAHLLKKLSNTYICLSYYSDSQLLSLLKQSLCLSYYSHWQLLSCLNAAAVTPKRLQVCLECFAKVVNRMHKNVEYKKPLKFIFDGLPVFLCSLFLCSHNRTIGPLILILAPECSSECPYLFPNPEKYI